MWVYTMFNLHIFTNEFQRNLRDIVLSHLPFCICITREMRKNLFGVGVEAAWIKGAVYSEFTRLFPFSILILYSRNG